MAYVNLKICNMLRETNRWTPTCCALCITKNRNICPNWKKFVESSPVAEVDMRQIEVDDLGNEEIVIVFRGMETASTNYDKRTTIWLSDDEADKLSFQIGCILQDKRRDKEGHDRRIEVAT